MTCGNLLERIVSWSVNFAYCCVGNVVDTPMATMKMCFHLHEDLPVVCEVRPHIAFNHT